MVRPAPAVLAGLFAMAAAGCGEPCPDASMLSGPEGLRVTESEHPDGWGQADCASCHAFEALHRSGCTPGVDLEAVQEQVEADGGESCSGCHGSNGTEAP